MYLVTGLDGVEKLVLICLYYRHTHNEISQRQYTFRDKDFLGGKKIEKWTIGEGGGTIIQDSRVSYYWRDSIGFKEFFKNIVLYLTFIISQS